MAFYSVKSLWEHLLMFQNMNYEIGTLWVSKLFSFWSYYILVMFKYFKTFTLKQVFYTEFV